jgi:hypothetical protein
MTLAEIAEIAKKRDSFENSQQDTLDVNLWLSWRARRSPRENFFSARIVGLKPDLQSRPTVPDLQFMGREQEAGFGAGDAVDQPDPPEHAVERFEAVGAQLGDHVPATVGAIERAHRRVAA